MAKEVDTQAIDLLKKVYSTNTEILRILKGNNTFGKNWVSPREFSKLFGPFTVNQLAYMRQQHPHIYKATTQTSGKYSIDEYNKILNK